MPNRAGEATTLMLHKPGVACYIKLRVMGADSKSHPDAERSFQLSYQEPQLGVRTESDLRGQCFRFLQSCLRPAAVAIRPFALSAVT